MNKKENSTTEFKEILNDKLEREVVAFLNSPKGGDIYIGITDDASIIGVENPDNTQLQIVDRIKNNISPNCLGFFDVILEEIEDKHIIHIIVTRGTEKPYYLKKFGMSPKGCFVRLGSSVQPMTTDMIEKSYSSRVQNSLRNITSPRYSKHSFAQLKIYYQENGYSINDNFLENLDLYTENGKLNYVAYLLADTNSLSLKVAKYLGTDKQDLIENEEYGYCSLIKATERILDKLEIENKTFALITGAAKRKERRMINNRALREALINAIVHNDYSKEVPPLVEIYSDRLTITSYGGLVNGLSLEEFYSGRSMPRNRELMRVFKDLDLVEQLGSGMHRILDFYPKNIYKISDNFLEICFPYEKEYTDYLKSEKRQDNSKTHQVTHQVNGKTHQVTHQVSAKTHQVTKQIKRLLINFEKNMSRNEILKSVNLKDRVTLKQVYLNPALKAGYIEMTQPNSPNSPTQKYRLTDKGLKLQEELRKLEEGINE